MKSSLVTTQSIKAVALHAAIIFLASFGGQLTLTSTGYASISTITALVVSAAMAGALVVIHYLAGLIPSLVTEDGVSLIPHGQVGAVVLHCVLVFIVTFGGQLASISVNSASYSTVVAFVSSAAITGVVAVASYLSGLVPSQASVLLRIPKEQ